MHPLVRLARDTIDAYVNTGKVLPVPRQIPEELKSPAGAFVSIHDRDGHLRGCIGTIEPTQPTLAEEVIRNAISSATRDPRFPPLGPEELESLVVNVDVLSPPEPIGSMEELDPRRYGVIVQRGQRRGLLLPDLEGVDSAEMQIEIARRKAGLNPDEPVDLYRFEVQRYY